MSKDTLLRWAPRVLTLAIAAFYAMFSLGAAMHMHTLVDGVMHFGPALLVLLAAGVAWRRPEFGAILLTTYAIAYAIWTRARLDWVGVIAVPLLVAAALYALHWRALRKAAMIR